MTDVPSTRTGNHHYPHSTEIQTATAPGHQRNPWSHTHNPGEVALGDQAMTDVSLTRTGIINLYSTGNQTAIASGHHRRQDLPTISAHTQ